MSEADKMLYEIGYEKVETNVDNLLEYEKQFPSYSKFIRFDLLDRTFTSFYYGIDMQSYLNMQELQAINMKVEELRMDIAETKRNIEYWENEVQQALKENDIMKAVGCRILANNLRKDIGESEI